MIAFVSEITRLVHLELNAKRLVGLFIGCVVSYCGLLRTYKDSYLGLVIEARDQSQRTPQRQRSIGNWRQTPRPALPVSFCQTGDLSWNM